MEDAEGISSSSFLAGALLKFESITDFELAHYITEYENTRFVTIYDNDIYKLSDIVYDDGNSFWLKKPLDEVYIGTSTVRDYLYEMTNSDIRAFFGIEERELSSSGSMYASKKNMFKKIRTRVFHLF